MSYIIHEEYSRSRQGASFFRAHFVAELDADWKEVFRGSNILSWKQDDDKGSVDLLIIGRLARCTIGLRTVVPRRVRRRR
jgi:hypothetical protein